jgi:hypothetical protein
MSVSQRCPFGTPSAPQQAGNSADLNPESPTRQAGYPAENSANPQAPTGETAAFWQALHRRVCDRIALPWARAWLAAYSRLEPSTAADWPVLRLVLEADPPPEAWSGLLHRHYRDALSAGCKNGPLADLARSLELG